MKLVAYLFLGLVSTLLPGTIPVGPQPFSLTIDAAQQRLRSGSQVEVELTLTNNSRSEITFVDSNRWCDYALVIRDNHERLAPQTSYARELKCSPRPTGKRMIRMLKPGQSFKDEMLVNPYYDLGRPGDYYIQLAREIPKELGQGTVKSNTVIVTVTEQGG